MLPLLVVSMAISGTSIPTIHQGADVVSLVVFSVHCLTCSSASFSFVFVLLAWIRSGPQAPSRIPFAISW